MSKDKDKKAERAESGKDAEILRLKAEIASFAEIKDAAEKYAEALRTEVSTVRVALATAEALIAKQTENWRCFMSDATEIVKTEVSNG